MIGQVSPAARSAQRPSSTIRPQAYVNKVGRWVASQSERPDSAAMAFRHHRYELGQCFLNPWRIHTHHSRPVRYAENESQLAGALGHEIGHIIKRHHITVMQKSAGVSAFAGAAQEAVASRGGGRSAALNNIPGTGAEVLARAGHDAGA